MSESIPSTLEPSTTGRRSAHRGDYLGIRMLSREWRSGELRLLAAAVVIAVTCLCAVSAFTDRLDRAMERGASELLAADLVVGSTQPIPSAISQRAEQSQLERASTVTFRSVVVAGERLQLAQVKAVDTQYPLRGRLLVDTDGNGEQAPRALSAPATGEAWIDDRLRISLGVEVGDRIGVGALNLVVAGIIESEPDRASEAFYLAPRLMFRYDQLAQSQLIQPGSRARYRLLLAGTANAVEQFRADIADELQANQEIQGIDDTQPTIKGALDRATRFLGLAALIGVLLSAIAIALSARRFAQKHYDSAALLRTLGASRATLFRIFLVQIGLLGLVSCLLGVAVGYTLQNGLSALFAPLLATELPAPGFKPGLIAFGVGACALLAFSLAPLLALANVPPMRVLRRTSGPALRRSAPGYLVAIVLSVGLLAWQAGDRVLLASLLGGLAVMVLAIGLLATAFIALVARLRVPLQGAIRSRGIRYGLANIARRQRASTVQLIAVSFGLCLLLMLTLVRGSLIDEWSQSFPADAPNHFLMNVQPDEVQSLSADLAAVGVRTPKFYPLSPSRLVEHNGKTVNPSDYESMRAQRLSARDFSLSSSQQPKSYNALVEGSWWSENDSRLDQFSVEQGIAQTLGFELGDTLTFLSGGEKITGQITSIRAVDWSSLGVNFFVETRPEWVRNVPATFIASVHIPTTESATMIELTRKYPSVTLIDLNAVLRTVRGIIDQVSRGIESVVVFTLIAGLLVLLCGIQASIDERRHEAAVLRALGATQQQIRAGLLGEFALLGALAGLLAAVAALAMGWLLASQVFNLGYSPAFIAIPIGVVAGAALVGLMGILATRNVVRAAPWQALRDLS